MYSMQAVDSTTEVPQIRETDGMRDMELSHTGIIYLDSRKRIKNLNREIERLFDLTAIHTIGRKAADVFEGFGEKLVNALTDFQEDCFSAHLQVRVRDNMIFIDLHSTEIRDTAGKSAGRVVIIQDMSALRAAIKQIQTTQMLMSLGELAAGVAHHIRTPLTTISGYLQVMLSRLEDDQYTVRRDVLETMLGEVSYINKVVKELILFAKPPLVREAEIDVNKLVDEALLLVFKQMGGEEIMIDKRLERTMPLLNIDRTLIKQALMNIMQNALEAMPAQGTLTLKSWYNAELGMAVLSIGDTGAGVQPEILPRVFEPFYTTKLDRMGLGLPIAHRIITEHGGFINISDQDGGGTKVHIYLPTGERDVPAARIIEQQILNLQ